MSKYLTVVLDTEEEGIYELMMNHSNAIVGRSVGNELTRLEELWDCADMDEVYDILKKIVC